MLISEIIEKKRNTAKTDLIGIISFVLSMSREEIFANINKEIEDSKLSSIETLMDERSRGKPLAYIIHRKEFFSEKFFVDERVLIPRPETEILVEEALKIIDNKHSPVSVLDMGTGSGVMGIIVAQRTSREVLCVDISLEALSVAKKNAHTLGVSHRIEFVCSDLFGGINKRQMFDVVLANLPYVSVEEWDYLMDDVRRHEPRIALHGGKEGMEVYKRFVRELPHYLNKDGIVLCEAGSSAHVSKLKSALESVKLHVVSKKDFSGYERVLIGSWKSL